MTHAAGEFSALQQQLTDATRHAESLRRVIEAISGEPALEPLLTRVVEHAVELIGAEYGTIGLVEERVDGPVIRVAAVHNLPLHQLGQELPVGLGLAGRVIKERRPLVLNRYGDLDAPTRTELLEDAVVGVPIWWADQLVGFFGIGASPPRRFTPHDCTVLEVFAHYAAIAIENARLFEVERQRANRIATINRIGRLITSSLSLKQVFQTAVEAIHTNLHFSYVAAGLVDPDDPEMLVLYAHAGHHTGTVSEGYRQSMDVGIVGEAARNREPVLVNDVGRDPRYMSLLQNSKIRAELAMPIAVEDKLLGVLNIEAEHPIGADDVESIEIVAAQLGIAIENARRFTEEQERTQRLGLIAHVGQLIAARLDPDELFDTTVEELHRRMGYEHVSLFLLDPHDPTWLVKRACASRWLGKASGYRQSIEQGIMGAAVRDRKPVLINDVANDPRYIAVTSAERLHAELAVPILLGDRLLGIVDVEGSRSFRPEDVTSIQIVADQLAVAIDNAQLFGDTQRALHETRRLAETKERLAVLEERQRLARDLHDSVTQLVFSMTLIAQSIAPAWHRDAAEGERRVNRLLELSQAALAEMRALLAELRPAEPASEESHVAPSALRVQRDGLADALRAYSSAVAQDGLRIEIDTRNYRRQSSDVETALYRIAQEALNNAVKHARARQVIITLAQNDNSTQLIVKDDGIGFSPHVANALPPVEPHISGGLGLGTMQERAETLGGTFQISTAPGSGTTISVVVPRS